MPRTKKVPVENPEKKLVPSEAVLRQMASLPEEAQNLVIGFCYGLKYQQENDPRKGGATPAPSAARMGEISL